MSSKIYRIKTETEMMNLGGKLSKICGSSCVIYLTGELGAGKTVLVRGFLRALGYKMAIKSPTYTLVESYKLNGKQIYHFDLYRVTNPSEELENIGIRDYFSHQTIYLIEWPENAGGMLPKADIICDIKIVNNERDVYIQTNLPFV
jgi:tRNA threonylcarbamoyladenosine biosynthesis protein TsaE